MELSIEERNRLRILKQRELIELAKSVDKNLAYQLQNTSSTQDMKGLLQDYGVNEDDISQAISKAKSNFRTPSQSSLPKFGSYEPRSQPSVSQISSYQSGMGDNSFLSQLKNEAKKGLSSAESAVSGGVNVEKNLDDLVGVAKDAKKSSGLMKLLKSAGAIKPGLLFAGGTIPLAAGVTKGALDAYDSIADKFARTKIRSEKRRSALERLAYNQLAGEEDPMSYQNVKSFLR